MGKKRKSIIMIKILYSLTRVISILTIILSLLVSFIYTTNSDVGSLLFVFVEIPLAIYLAGKSLETIYSEKLAIWNITKE